MGDGVKRERKGKERDGRWGKEREKGEKEMGDGEKREKKSGNAID